jgi:hypothetical protein
MNQTCMEVDSGLQHPTAHYLTSSKGGAGVSAAFSLMVEAVENGECPATHGLVYLVPDNTPDNEEEAANQPRGRGWVLASLGGGLSTGPSVNGFHPQVPHARQYGARPRLRPGGLRRTQGLQQGRRPWTWAEGTKALLYSSIRWSRGSRSGVWLCYSVGPASILFQHGLTEVWY